MHEFSALIWTALACIGGLTIIGLFNAVAAALRDETALHDTRIEVNTIRNHYLREMLESEAFAGTDVVQNLRLSGTAKDK